MKIAQSTESRPPRDSREVTLENIRGLCDAGRQFLDSCIALFAIIEGGSPDDGCDYEAADEARRDFNYNAAQLAGTFRAIKGELRAFEPSAEGNADDNISAAAEE